MVSQQICTRAKDRGQADRPYPLQWYSIGLCEMIRESTRVRLSILWVKPGVSGIHHWDRAKVVWKTCTFPRSGLTGNPTLMENGGPATQALCLDTKNRNSARRCSQQTKNASSTPYRELWNTWPVCQIMNPLLCIQKRPSGTGGLRLGLQFYSGRHQIIGVPLRRHGRILPIWKNPLTRTGGIPLSWST
ncbi:hypothetical protein TCAL_15393 [Tigriopus californicus]|uniref:Uncharacterized protein n=1 Tax=Tigriopus californicus TaxID=6832 RepID=A0A553PL54_TIGCA|nr:hypothetical protein TCAL_15393 [Tigriopus californicus]